MRIRSMLASAVTCALLGAGAARAVQRPKVAIGYVTSQQAPCDAGSTYLVADKANRWLVPHWELGFLHLTGAEKFEVPPLENKLVMAIGRVDPDYAPQTPGKSCVKDDEAWRRDALPGQRGPRIMNDRMGPLAHVGGFIVEQAAVIDPLSALRVGKKVQVTFRSPVEKTLRYVTLWAQYDPCEKPGARKLRSESFKKVSPKANLSADFPAELVEGRTRHVLAAIWVTTDDEDVMFDLSWPLPAGLAVCPGG